MPEMRTRGGGTPLLHVLRVKAFPPGTEECVRVPCGGEGGAEGDTRDSTQLGHRGGDLSAVDCVTPRGTSLPFQQYTREDDNLPEEEIIIVDVMVCEEGDQLRTASP